MPCAKKCRNKYLDERKIKWPQYLNCDGKIVSEMDLRPQCVKSGLTHVHVSDEFIP